MSGVTSRRGFRYQDLYLLSRVLEAMADGAEEGRQPIAEFGLEARQTDDLQEDSATWDVVLRSTSQAEIIEVKSGALPKSERLAFWKRLRKEGNNPTLRSLVPKLVCDPDKMSGLPSWRGLATEAVTRKECPRSALSGDVNSSRELCDEALWHLTNPNSDETVNALTPETAIALLSCFVLEKYSKEQLERQVDCGIELLLPDGLTDPTRNLIQGWLIERAVASNEAMRYFTVEKLVEAIGIHHDCMALHRGVLGEWKTLWTDLSRDFLERTRVKLGSSGPVVPLSEGQLGAGATLTIFHAGGRIILGEGGGGKSGVAAQLSQCLGNEQTEVFTVSADAIGEDEVLTLVRSLRFKKALQRFKSATARFVFIVDGLDEAETELREQWVRSLNRLAGVPEMSVIVTMREGVWNADKATQSLLKAWDQVRVKNWSEALIMKLISDANPKIKLTHGLRTILRQPLMLDVFWRTFIEPETPSLREPPVTRYQLISAYWAERFVTSPRHVAVLPSETLNSILQQAAHSLEPFTTINDVRTGIEALVSESVLLREGRLEQRLRFRHLLLRDFALSFWCLSGVDAAEVMQRWTDISGGLRKHGSLRGMLEAISDASFANDFPHLQWREILEQMVLNAEGQEQLVLSCGD